MFKAPFDELSMLEDNERVRLCERRVIGVGWWVGKGRSYMMNVLPEPMLFSPCLGRPLPLCPHKTALRSKKKQQTGNH